MIRRKILAAVDPWFIHHQEYTKDLPVANLSGAKYQKTELTSFKGESIYYTRWRVHSADDPIGTYYLVKVALAKLKPNLDMQIPIKLAITDAITTGDLYISCEDPSWLYWGYKYICTKKGVIFKQSERRPPRVRNPRMRGIICKHLHLVLDVLPFNIMKIYSDVQKLYKPSVQSTMKLKKRK